MSFFDTTHHATRNLPASETGTPATCSIGAIAAVTVALAVFPIAGSASPAQAADIECAGAGMPLSTPHVQIVFDSTTRTCVISDAGPAPENGLRAFVIPGFSTPTALGQKIENAAILPPDSYTTTWTNAAAADGPYARGFASNDLGTFKTILTGAVNGTTYTMETVFTLASGRSMTIDSARVRPALADHSLLTSSVPESATP